MEVKYDNIGIGYNETRRADEYIFDRLRYHLKPNKKGLYLDIGCGTGNYTDKFQQKGFHFIGIDPSNQMLQKAKEKNEKIKWMLGDAEKTSLENDSISGIIATLTIHHWKDLSNGLVELFRILKKEGKIVIFTSTPRQMNGYWLHHYFPKMMRDSMQQMPSFKDLETAMKKVGFTIEATEKYFVKPDLKDLFLYAGKYRPELYHDFDVQRGISSFSSLSIKKEVDDGLLQMKRDINSRKIAEVIHSYENDTGDYLFVIAKRIKN